MEKAAKGHLKNIITKDVIAFFDIISTSIIFFTGKWIKKFHPKDDKDEPFFDETGNLLGLIPMMSTSITFGYSLILNNSAVALELLYVGSELSMIIIQPNHNALLDNILNVLWINLNCIQKNFI